MKARPLPPGGTIGVAAASSPFEERSEIDRSVRWYEERGYRVKLAEHVYARDDFVAGDAEARARDVNQLFADSEVDIVQLLRGGYGASQVVPHLDFDLIAENPKPLVGFSDITALRLNRFRPGDGAARRRLPLAPARDARDPVGGGARRLDPLLRGRALPALARRRNADAATECGKARPHRRRGDR